MSRRFSLHLAVAALLCALASCSSWKTVESGPRWELLSEDPTTPAERRAYADALEPAFDAVAQHFGEFRRRVSVHMWDGDPASSQAPSGSSQMHEARTGAVQDVPGIGPARVRAFHARSRGIFGTVSGVYLGTPETGTAAHELVHARLAEEELNLPLWLEEGLASLVGDGYCDGRRWIVDGLACWPLRELTEARLDDRELAALLALLADDSSDVRQNVLAHFVGWAIVFDLYRESGELDWREWIETFGKHIDLVEARTRLSRTLAPSTLSDWLKRLDHADRGVRIATAKGTWKLRSPLVVEALLDRLDREDDPIVRLALGINVLAAAGEMRLPSSLQERMWRTVWPSLRRAKLEDPIEAKAVEDLLRSFRWGARQSPREPLEKLRRYWAE